MSRPYAEIRVAVNKLLATPTKIEAVTAWRVLELAADRAEIESPSDTDLTQIQRALAERGCLLAFDSARDCWKLETR